MLGRELFDKAFKEYARRWKFKRPEPADFFRTMEDASGVDLDWFWRGWFYTTDHCDISIDRVRLFTIDTQNPDVEKPARSKERKDAPTTLAQQRNEPLPKRVDQDPSLKDFYNTYDELKVTEQATARTTRSSSRGSTTATRRCSRAGMNFYVVELSNIGGLVMPVILQIDYADGTSEELRIPAEIWRLQQHEGLEAR